MKTHPLLVSAIVTGLALPSLALDIRGYTPARHDRFTGTSDAPALNGEAWFDAGAYTGVGWSASDPRRQFVLVSPQHFVLASHWCIAAGEAIRFLAPDGTLHDFTVESVTPVTTDGHGTDLSLGRLTSPVPAATGIAPLPYLNLPDTSDYTGLALQVFGANGRVGTGVLTGYNHLDMGTGMTWMSYFDYRANQTGQDDCHFEIGDSGSPSFALSNGKPALVGTHSASFTDSVNSFYFSYDSFVPTYVPQLDELLAADGWRMTPSDPAPTALAGVKTTSPSPLQAGVAGTAKFTIKNTARVDDGNVRVTLRFPDGAAPDTVSGDGWVAEENGPGMWIFRRATLAARGSASLIASWETVPPLSTLTPQLTISSDGCADQSQTLGFSSKKGGR